jgi:hypothetical protein
MSNHINGSAICSAVISFLAFYILVMINLFKNEIRDIIFSKNQSFPICDPSIQSNKKTNLISKDDSLVHSSNTWPYNQNNEQKFFPAQRSSIRDIDTSFKSTTISDKRKEALIKSLYQIIKKYSTIKKSRYVHSASFNRDVRSDTISSIHLDEDWKCCE